MIAVISDVHFPSNAERQKIMETGLKKLTGIRALFICGVVSTRIISQRHKARRGDETARIYKEAAISCFLY